MNTQVVTIQSKQFTIPAPFAEGHVLNPAEAAVLNQTYAENVRNNFAAQMKKVIEANEEAAKKGEAQVAVPGQEELDKYTAEYSFGIRGTGTPRLDPVVAEANRLIKIALTKALEKRGQKIKDISAEDLAGMIEKVRNDKPEFLERAKALVAAKAAAVDGLEL